MSACICHQETINGVLYDIISPSCPIHGELTHWIPETLDIVSDREEEEEQ